MITVTERRVQASAGRPLRSLTPEARPCLACARVQNMRKGDLSRAKLKDKRVLELGSGMVGARGRRGPGNRGAGWLLAGWF